MHQTAKNNRKKRGRYARYGSVFFVVVIFLVASNIDLVRAFVEPSALPPGGNVEGPVTVGLPDQTKSGALTVNTSGTAADGLTVEQGDFLVRDGLSSFSNGVYSDPDVGGTYDAKFGGANDGIAVRGESYFDGNVGIGTTSPSEKLHIDGNVLIEEHQPTLTLRSSSTFIPGSAVLNLESWLNGAEIRMGIRGDVRSTYIRANTIFMVGDKPRLDFYTGDEHRMAIFPSGGVGIGPGHSDFRYPSSGLMLDVHGRVGATEYCDEDGHNCLPITAFGAGLWENDPANTIAKLSTLSDGSTARPSGTEFVAHDNGNVGIGTTSPGAKLDVQGQIIGGFGAITTGGVLDWNDISNTRSGNGYTLLLGSATNGPGNATYFHPFNFEYNSKDGVGNMTQFAIPYGATSHMNSGMYMRGRYSGSWSPWMKIISENSAGNVGIGTITPDNLLDLGDTYGTNVGDANAKKLAVYQSDGTNFYGLGVSTGTLEFHAQSVATELPGMVLTGANSVGIGDTSPDGTLKLDVEGQIGATEYCDQDGLNCVPAGHAGANSIDELTDAISDEVSTVFLGTGSGVNSTGLRNTAVGINALATNVAGSDNVAVGFESLLSNTSGSRNLALGSYALHSNTIGNYNTATGFNALFANLSGEFNSAQGEHALYFNTSGSYNSAQGFDALRNNTTADRNTAQGAFALRSNTTGYNNTAVGVRSLQANINGRHNTAVGFGSLYDNIGGINNTAVGTQALYHNTTGSNNSAQGRNALLFNITGSNNSAQGTNALFTNDSGDYNSAQGTNAMHSNISGSYNSAQGAQALYSNTTGSNNSAQGVSALYGNTTGSNNSAQGVNALRANITGYDNSAQGANALYSNTTGFYNTATGSNALYFNVDGSNNTAQGKGALQFNTTGSSNSAQGTHALYSNTTGVDNSAHGAYALFYNTTGSSNSAQGPYVLYSNTTGVDNSAHGAYALYYNTTGVDNSAHGAYALLYNMTGNNNSAQGTHALYANTTGNNNSAQGPYALYANTTGNNNSAQGPYALYANTTGSSNSAQGVNAGRYITDGATSNTTGDFNVFLGSDAKALADDDQNEIVIGYNAVGIGSNTAVFGNDAILTTVLKGNVGIGDTSPDGTLKLDVEGQIGATEYCDENGLNCTAPVDLGAGLWENDPANTIAKLSTLSDGSTARPVGTEFVAHDNGNIGIGTTSPSQKLHISQGDIQIDNTTFANQDGIIYKGSTPFIHNFNYGNNGTVTTDGNNTFVGRYAGNLTMGATATGAWHGSYNTAIGYSAFNSNTTGYWNTAVGRVALQFNTTGFYNTAQGALALYRNTTGSYNTGLGMQALQHNETGSSNTAIGRAAGYGVSGASNVTGNTLLGYTSGFGLLTGGNYNTLLGYAAGDNITTGGNNIIIGQSVDAPSPTGSNQLNIGNTIYGDLSTGNVGIGTPSPSTKLEVTGNVGEPASIFRGGSKLTANTGDGQIAVSYNPSWRGEIGYAYSAGDFYIDNTWDNNSGDIHFRTKTAATPVNAMTITGSGNVGIGVIVPSQKLHISQGDIQIDNTTFANQDGIIYKGSTPFIHNFNYGNNGTVTTDGNNTFVGLNAGNLTMGATATDVLQGSYNTGIGDRALQSNTIGRYNTALGNTALRANTTGASNIAVGSGALFSNTTGESNTAIGTAALYSNVSGSLNVSIGANTLVLNVDGIRNTAIGDGALYNNVSGSDNNGIGINALRSNTTGTLNTANGSSTLFSNVSGDYNTAQGASALYSNHTGSSNTAQGYAALHANVTGNTNTAMGMNSLTSNVGGYANTAHGYSSLNLNVSGHDNTAIGVLAGEYTSGGVGSNTTGDFNVFLGASTRALADDDQNEIVIGYGTTGIGSNSVTLGNASIATTVLRGDVGVSTETPVATLDVNGGVAFAVKTVTTHYSVLTSDNTILCDASGGNHVMSLPNVANSNGFEVTIKKIDSTASTCIVQDGATNIDGAPSYILNIQYDSVTVMSDGTQWWIK